jgi:hypothetical protein
MNFIIIGIQDGTTHVVWSFGKGPLYQLEGLDLTDPDSSTDNGKAESWWLSHNSHIGKILSICKISDLNITHKWIF